MHVLFVCFLFFDEVVRIEHDINVKSPFPTQACLQVGKRTWDTPKHELQDIQWMSALQRPQRSADRSGAGAP